MKRSRLQIPLMLFTILAVTGFQLFWLKQTYDREKKSLELKTDFVFRDALLNLQVSNLKLSSETDTSRIREVKLKRGDSADANFTLRLNESKGMVSTINVISRKMSGASKSNDIKSEILVRHDYRSDSGGGPLMLQFLYGVDSLQKAINIKKLEAAVLSGLKKQQIDIPFVVAQADSSYRPGEDRLNEVSIGIAHPQVYRFIPGNTFFYLLKRISMPVLFSVLLTLLTVLSFLLLYRNLRRQQKITDSKNEFIANMTHELKTPIATVSVAIEALRDFDAIKEPARAGEYLAMAGQELSRLSMMVDKVLKLSVFEDRSAEIKQEQFDFAVLTREVLQTMQLQFEKAGAAPTLNLSGNDFYIRADRMHMASVLYNLLDNAIKYSDAKPVIGIDITAESDALIINISDEGIGIDPAYRSKIFEKFFRVPHGDLHNVKGYGLGLSYAAHIAAQHNGSIRAAANEGKGTVFTIKVPRNHAD